VHCFMSKLTRASFSRYTIRDRSSTDVRQQIVSAIAVPGCTTAACELLCFFYIATESCGIELF
jgi:hypothetical protein